MKHIHADNMLLYAQDAQETETPWLRWEELRRFGSNPYERELTIRQGVPDDTKNNNQSRQKRCRV